MGKIVAISISNEKGTIKTPVTQAAFKENFGIVGDAHAGDWHRQVSLLALESIEPMRAKTTLSLTPGIFAENLTTEGLILSKVIIGQRLMIGDVILEITQIGKQCHNDCEIKKQVGDCVMPREGIFAKVLRGGIVNAGDEILLI